MQARTDRHGETWELPDASTIEGSLRRDRVSAELARFPDDISPAADALSDLAVKTEGLSATELIELLQADQLRRWRAGEVRRPSRIS